METTERLFHVVCRECQTERLLESVEDATRVADDHAAETGHLVVFDRIT